MATKSGAANAQQARRCRRGVHHRACVRRRAGDQFRQPLAVRGERGRQPEGVGARVGLVDRDLGQHAAGARRHHRDARGEKYRLDDAVGDEDDGQSACGPQRQQLAVEPLPREFVERAERLVHQQQVRRGDERAGDRRTHLHAARELAREMAGEIGQADQRERGIDIALGGGARHAGEIERQPDVGRDAGPRHQRRATGTPSPGGVRDRRWRRSRRPTTRACRHPARSGPPSD